MRSYVKRVKQKAEKLSKEQVLSLLEDVVDENENLFSVLESLSTGLLIIDDDYRLLRYNTIAESWLPFSERLEDILGTENAIWEYVEDEDVSNFLRNCMEKNTTNCSEDFSTVTSGGSVRFLTVTISPLITEGELNGKVILVRDITEKKNQDILLHRMENLANLTNLAAGMAHEIKNPLGAISIHIQLIQKALAKARENDDKLPAPKFVEDHIDIVNEEIDHLNKLVMDFLLAVRPVKAQLQLKEPDKLVENLVSFFKPEFNREGIEVIFKSSESGKRILLDEKLFRDVIMNISQNSLAAIKSKYIGDRIGAKFCISNSVRENKFIITIADNGCGMSEETLAKIFEPYYTTKANGTGLGMTMVYKIIKEFSGEIIVDSKEGEGTAFTITFPIPQKDTKLLTSESR
ncbi:two-component system sensor histidine kinase NtrB [Treponema bryantii]|uniref:two-component system sensor histidine kinase NtrB n=1 Tax=Treponema bryantii TaxID=163 RepID=UPI002B30B8C2|nr:PAS domain-containing sensor histidine kinase [Treponema bryantii]